MKADISTHLPDIQVLTHIHKHGHTDAREIKGFEYVCIDYFKLLAHLSLDLQSF